MKYINQVEQLRKQNQNVVANCNEIAFFNFDPVAANVVTVNGLPIPGAGGFISFDGKAGETDETSYAVISVNPVNTFVIRKKYI